MQEWGHRTRSHAFYREMVLRKETMGYRKQTKIYKLVFDDPEMDGLEVRAKSLSIGQLRRFMGFRVEDGQSEAQTEEVLQAFAKCLVEWNLEDDNGPVPATEQGINDQESSFIMTVVNAWIEAVSGVDNDLGKGSPSGRQFPEASIPMETLSPSPVS